MVRTCFHISNRPWIRCDAYTKYILIIAHSALKIQSNLPYKRPPLMPRICGRLREVVANQRSDHRGSKFLVICIWQLRKMGLTGLHGSCGSWHLYICRFLFGFSIFLSLHSCYEGHLVLFCKEKIES